jgi:hypothetical protein
MEVVATAGAGVEVTGEGKVAATPVAEVGSQLRTVVAV